MRRCQPRILQALQPSAARLGARASGPHSAATMAPALLASATPPVPAGAFRADAPAAGPARASQRRRRLPRASQKTDGPAEVAQNGSEPELQRRSQEGRLAGGAAPRSGRRRRADSTDWVASTLTRRFGVAGGLAWLGILSFGVISEQVKTRLEDKAEREGTQDVVNIKEVTTSSGLRYTDLKLGGGAPVQRGFLVVLDYKGTADGEVFEDTKSRGKPIVFTFGARPFTGGLCRGVEEALATMKTGGVRRVLVPPVLGFGNEGIAIRPTLHAPGKQGTVPPGATLEYELSLLRVSIPPS